MAHRKDITISHQDETAAVVIDGVKPGDTVVTDGASRVTDGAHVKVLAGHVS